MIKMTRYGYDGIKVRQRLIDEYYSEYREKLDSTEPNKSMWSKIAGDGAPWMLALGAVIGIASTGWAFVGGAVVAVAAYLTGETLKEALQGQALREVDRDIASGTLVYRYNQEQQKYGMPLSTYDIEAMASLSVTTGFEDYAQLDHFGRTPPPQPVTPAPAVAPAPEIDPRVKQTTQTPIVPAFKKAAWTPPSNTDAGNAEARPSAKPDTPKVTP